MKKSSPGTEGGAKTDVLTSRFHFTQAGGQSTETIDRLLFKPVMVIVDITHEPPAVVVPGLIDTNDKADEAFRLVEAARGCTSCAQRTRLPPGPASGPDDGYRRQVEKNVPALF
jgi:hypothetical protein